MDTGRREVYLHENIVRRFASNPRDNRNIVRIRGVDNPLVNWIDLDAKHSFPINRAGNPPAPAAPRKPKDQRFKSRNPAQSMLPKKLFEVAVGDREKIDSDHSSCNHH
ncbi:hypothetical protein PoB_001593700 [Plakobranchus ocellatus]|uniref:Uncharacterized protein n=1 Tax=Plakobranchus ocellatus TaxID=259542 RepID=A0AAV3Z2J6_9GAST|nr:hypothetical protein PoB_001593700 [Plakobranchus ocellatus]